MVNIFYRFLTHTDAPWSELGFRSDTNNTTFVLNHDYVMISLDRAMFLIVDKRNLLINSLLNQEIHRIDLVVIWNHLDHKGT